MMPNWAVSFLNSIFVSQVALVVVLFGASIAFILFNDWLYRESSGSKGK
jgi:hypothetical protein